MKIHYQLEEERESKEKIISEIKNNTKKNIFLDIFDKAAFIESVANGLKKGEKIAIKIDEESDDYPNILKNSPPRLIIQEKVEGEKILLSDYLKRVNEKSFEISLNKEKNDYILYIKKTSDEKLDLKLKLDSDKTIDLSLLSSDRNKNDKTYFGVRSYYYTKKN